MKRLAVVIVLGVVLGALAVTALRGGWTSRERSMPLDTEEQGTGNGTEAQTPSARETVDALKKVEDGLTVLQERIAELRERSVELGGGARERWQETIASLQERWEQLRAETARMRETGADKWEEAKTRTSRAYEELQQAIEAANGEGEGG